MRVCDRSCGETRIYLELEVRRVACRDCGKVTREQLDFLADNPLYTKRFAYYVGRRCRQATIKDVAKELALDWHTFKALEKQYLAHAGTPWPRAIVDEISIRKGHTYRIVVSDLRGQRGKLLGRQHTGSNNRSSFRTLGLGARLLAGQTAVKPIKPPNRATNGEFSRCPLVSWKY
jgi:transposase